MTSTLTRQQVEAYAATLRARTIERQRLRERRREQAWSIARQAADLLRERYRASQVWAFGSLVEGEHLTERSDIDTAVAGLDPMTHLEALGRLLGLSSEFEFDLVDMEHCPAGIRRAVEQHGVAL